MEEYSRIGHLNLIKGMQLVTLGKFSSIGKLNWITGVPNNSKHFRQNKDRSPSLIIDENSAITHRHIIDCTACINIGKFTTVAGYNSHFLTHSIDLAQNMQSSLGIVIGNYCFIGTNCIFLPGSCLPDYCVLGALSLLNKNYTENYTLYAGTPAKPIKTLPHDWQYFKREQGYVD